MKKCLIMFGILLVVVIVACIMEHKTANEVLNDNLAMETGGVQNILSSNK